MMKVLIVQGYIPHYRIPIFNKLGDKEDLELTIIHSGETIGLNAKNFTEIIVPCSSFFGFKWQKGVFQLSEKYDVVIAMFDLYWLSSLMTLFFSNCKFIYWGIGKGRKKLVNYLRKIIFCWIDALILYSDNDVSFFTEKNKGKIFMANNTLFIENSKDSSALEKKSIIFVGTLYEGKGLEDLIVAFSRLQKSSYKLVIVGEGILKEKLLELCVDLEISKQVDFKGFINDYKVLENLYSEAICSVSPNQAGLSVLQSMAFGVPFITSSDAYSGGEKFNIVDNSTGLFYDNNGLLTALQKIVNDEVYAREMGHNAYKHFVNNCSVDNMVSGFVDSINFVMKKKND